MSLETLRADFDLFDDWEDRYKYIIELGTIETAERIELMTQQGARCVSRFGL